MDTVMRSKTMKSAIANYLETLRQRGTLVEQLGLMRANVEARQPTPEGIENLQVLKDAEADQRHMELG